MDAYQWPEQTLNIQRTCQASGYSFELVDTHSGYLCAVTKGGQQRYFGASFISAYPINSATAANIATDKAFTAMVLARAGAAVPQGDYFFTNSHNTALRNAGKTVHDALAFANTLGYPCIAKPVKGSRGDFVQVVYNDTDLGAHLQQMAGKYHAAMVQQLVQGVEYRVFVIDGATKFYYTKEPVQRTFNSVQAFETSLKDENRQRLLKSLNPFDLNSQMIARQRERVAQGLPVVSQLLNVSSAHVTPKNFSTAIPELIADISQKIYHAMRLRVFAYEMIVPANNPTSTYAVIEVNANPRLTSLDLLNQEQILISIWKEIIDKTFAID